MARTIVSAMERDAAKFQLPRKILGLVRGKSQLICGKDIPDLSNRAEDLPMFATFFGGVLTEIKE